MQTARSLLKLMFSSGHRDLNISCPTYSDLTPKGSFLSPLSHRKNPQHGTTWHNDNPWPIQVEASSFLQTVPGKPISNASFISELSLLHCLYDTGKPHRLEKNNRVTQNKISYIYQDSIDRGNSWPSIVERGCFSLYRHWFLVVVQDIPANVLRQLDSRLYSRGFQLIFMNSEVKQGTRRSQNTNHVLLYEWYEWIAKPDGKPK